jgi:hypothetical protein
MGSHYSAKGLQKPLPAHINCKKVEILDWQVFQLIDIPSRPEKTLV